MYNATHFPTERLSRVLDSVDHIVHKHNLLWNKTLDSYNVLERVLKSLFFRAIDTFYQYSAI